MAYRKHDPTLQTLLKLLAARQGPRPSAKNTGEEWFKRNKIRQRDYVPYRPRRYGPFQKPDRPS